MIESKVITFKKSKSWQLTIDKRNNFPILGYYHQGMPYNCQNNNALTLEKNQNILLSGKLFFISFYKGRSAIVFTFEDDIGNEFTTTASGMEKLLNYIGDGNFTCNTGEWFGETRTVVEGNWICQKQGTEVSLLPVPLGFEYER